MDGGYGYNAMSHGGHGDGGGFMPGEMTSPAGSRGVDNNTLRPVTVKQALDAIQPYPEANFQIDGADASSICFIGQVRNISSQSTNVTYKIDDGTGEIEVKQWNDPTAPDHMDTTDDDDHRAGGSGPAKQHHKAELNGYAKVFGKLKAFGNRRYVGAHCVRALADLNELQCHLLEATAVHLFFTRGPPVSAAGDVSIGGGASGAAAAAAGGAAAAGAAAAAAAGAVDGSSRALSSMTPVARRVYALLKNEPQSNEGLHAQLIAAKLNLPVTDVTRAGDELLSQGVIFSTVDEMTWAILEY